MLTGPQRRLLHSYSEREHVIHGRQRGPDQQLPIDRMLGDLQHLYEPQMIKVTKAGHDALMTRSEAT